MGCRGCFDGVGGCSRCCVALCCGALRLMLWYCVWVVWYSYGQTVLHITPTPTNTHTILHNADALHKPHTRHANFQHTHSPNTTPTTHAQLTPNTTFQHQQHIKNTSNRQHSSTVKPTPHPTQAPTHTATQTQHSSRNNASTTSTPNTVHAAPTTQHQAHTKTTPRCRLCATDTTLTTPDNATSTPQHPTFDSLGQHQR